MADLLFRIGTVPEYRPPKIDDGLIEAILDAFDSATVDGLPTNSRDQLVEFMKVRCGCWLAFGER